NTRGQVCESRLRQVHGYLWDTAFMPSSGDVDALGPGLFHGCREGPGFDICVAPGDKVVAGNSDYQGHLRTYGLLDPAYDLKPESHSIFKWTAVFVVSLVGLGRQELADQV